MKEKENQPAENTRMPDREKIRLMTKLSILETHYGKKIRKAENTSRIDLITNPVWKWGIIVTLVFFLAAGALAALNSDMVLDAVAGDQTRNLIMILLISWLSLLAVTILITSVLSYAGTRRIGELREQYRQMLQALERINAMEQRGTRQPRAASREEDLWETPPERRSGRRGRRTREEDLDYTNMQVMEFEDDDYCYYVEAVPKRGGRRG